MDAALDNFVSFHYESLQMSWLHSFWGIGATTGPYNRGLCLAGGKRWNSGYQAVGVIQVVLVIILLLSLSQWRTDNRSERNTEQEYGEISLKSALKLPGAKAILTAFFCYCALEATTGL